MAKIPPEYDNPRDRDQWLAGFADSYRGRRPQSTSSAYRAGHAANEWRKARAEAASARRRWPTPKDVFNRYRNG